ncbi:hypothetical protein AUR64_10720 [Haloprofundus marisrubri]|uniref:DUF7978 domain-containing protein n=1 Tax=Haloprofundus marisrubri TaxID=1514971 RepID=A0A0W1R9Y3_9EURY|nr:hypothetical protein [Haloprofundus marisrubri]KTG10064.1 hypothetical protein AUR64_10720 [Haloprofundus marisrubri]
MPVTHLPLRRSASVGAVVYAVGYAVTVAATAGRTGAVAAIEIAGETADAAPLGEILGSDPASWIASGWLFYNAHLVPTSVPIADAVNGLGGLTNQSLLATLGGPLYALYLLPPLLLVAAGYAVVRTAETPGSNGARNAGASVVAGYFPLLLLGAFVFTAGAAEAQTVASPAGLSSVFLGLAYPLVFGGIGGMVADKRTSASSPAGEVADA